jgi:hypothetical protein
VTAQQLADDLVAMIGHPGRGKVVSIHLFGITRARELRGVSLEEVVRIAGIEKSYGVKIRKGMALAEWVDVKVGL